MFSTKLFSQSITIETYINSDGYNVPTYGTSHVCKARQESDFVYLRENFRELQTTDTVVYVYSPSYTPVIRDRVTLINGETFPVKHIMHNRDDKGNIKFFTLILGQ